VRFACPRDRAPLSREGDELACAEGHRYASVEGIPVLLLEEEQPTHAACRVSLQSREPTDDPEALVQDAIAATCGNLYRHLVGNVTRYPIPDLRLADGEGRRFLEVGCNWGRWCVSAARRGYEVVGVDPSLDALRAARRVADELGVEATYVAADARHLPFADASFDVVTCRVAAHHFDDPGEALAEMARVSRALVLMSDNLYLGEAGEQADRLRDPTHVRNLSEAEWRDLFSRVGLDVEAFEREEKWLELEPWLERAGCSEDDAARVRDLLADRIRDGRVRVDRGIFKGRKA
jgi:SAM-dependent methyltransferase